MRDLANNLGVAVLIPSATYDADNTPAALDIRGFDSCMICISVGVGGITFSGTNKVEYKLTHSDDNVTYAAVEQRDVLLATVGTGGIIKSLIAAHAAADVTKIGYIGDKPYLKLLADFSGTHGTGTPMGAIAVLGHAARRPVA
ncbi:hypothetical protein P7L78_22000 [Tistrella bauzanensis]|uniref:hypothetical protein n=1 Tax=Tistrella TaxID=171436 RepID=UPI0031F69BF6